MISQVVDPRFESPAIRKLQHAERRNRERRRGLREAAGVVGRSAGHSLKVSPQKLDNSRERRVGQGLKKTREESGAHDHSLHRSLAHSENFYWRKSCSRIISSTSER